MSTTDWKKEHAREFWETAFFELMKIGATALSGTTTFKTATLADEALKEWEARWLAEVIE